MKYMILTFENRLFIIKQTSCNSEILINDLMDLHNRLSKACKYRQDSRREKIILILNTISLVHSLIDASFKERSIVK